VERRKIETGPGFPRRIQDKRMGHTEPWLDEAGIGAYL